eukprot:4867058-Prymnesium_polylepis.1
MRTYADTIRRVERAGSAHNPREHHVHSTQYTPIPSAPPAPIAHRPPPAPITDRHAVSLRRGHLRHGRLTQTRVDLALQPPTATRREGASPSGARAT